MVRKNNGKSKVNYPTQAKTAWVGHPFWWGTHFGGAPVLVGHSHHISRLLQGIRE